MKLYRIAIFAVLSAVAVTGAFAQGKKAEKKARKQRQAKLEAAQLKEIKKRVGA